MRRLQEEEQNRLEEAEAKRAADGQVWAKQVATQAAALAASQSGFDQFWNSSFTIQKRLDQMRKATQAIPAPQATRQKYLQEYIGTPIFEVGKLEPEDLYHHGDVASSSVATPLLHELVTSSEAGKHLVSMGFEVGAAEDTPKNEANIVHDSVHDSATNSDIILPADVENSIYDNITVFAETQPQVAQQVQIAAMPTLLHFNLLQFIVQVVQAFIGLFDDRPLAPLTQAVNAIVMKLKQYPSDTEQLGMLIKKGDEVTWRIQQQRYELALDFNECVLCNTLEEKLSCHLRLYRCITFWSLQLTDTERDAFEAIVIHVFKKRFLCADTAVQQSLLTYWEKGGSCYTDIIQHDAIADWLSQSLCLDISQEALITNNMPLHNRFMQNVWRLVQQKQVPVQQNLLNQLLWSLRVKQQAYQVDLLTLCKLMEWLPSDIDQAMLLLNNEADDWFHTLKEHWITTRLKCFKNQYQAEELSELSSLLSYLPWDVAIINSFLSAVVGNQDYTELRDFLVFLKKYHIEERTLLHLFHSKSSDDVAFPCMFLHHALACELLQEPLKMFKDLQSDALYGQLTTLLRSNLGAYNALYSLLTTLQAADMTQQQRREQALRLQEVFTLLNDYGATKEACIDTFQSITSQPPSQWEEATHKLVVAATFHSSQDLSTHEIIDYIAKNAMGIFFANDTQQLQNSYDALVAAYQAPSAVLHPISFIEREEGKAPEAEKNAELNNRTKSQPSIVSWSGENITKWAHLVKDLHIQVSQTECLAVIQRAVVLHHGILPRTTQLLAVLALLNTPKNMGRLAQINTGEGKSLIVAMLAAVHALQGQTVDVLTTSTELSIPEIKKQTPFFTALGLTVGENSKKNAADDEARYVIYQKNIVYGTSEDFQADIISTEFFQRNIRGHRGFGVVLVDEVDSMLFDDRNYSTQLSSLIPAMNHLEIIYGTLWSFINLLASRLRTIDGQYYFIDPKVGFEDTPGGGVKLPEDRMLSDCAYPVENPIVFLKEKTTGLYGTFIRQLTQEEQKAQEEQQAQELCITELNKNIQELEQNDHCTFFALPLADRDTKLESLKAEHKSVIEALEHSAWSVVLQERPYIEVPRHLRTFASKQMPHWIESAIYALLCYQKDQHYHVKGGKIVPIDYSNTGVLQYNTVWDNGKVQFLQIKEGLKVTPESISTNFISKPGFFKRYEHRLYGLTGTLGNATTRSFLQEIYGVDMVTIPPYKVREILGNDASLYLCKELLPRLVSTSAAWYEAVTESVLRPARNGQAVLVICNYISHVYYLRDCLISKYDARKLFSYTGEEDFKKHQVDTGDIILATNIAGRGTDLTASAAVEKNGGLHVCITFLPASYRVELQNAGRTARQGKKGSAQLVLLASGAETLQDLRQQRDRKESQGIEQARKDVANMLSSDHLFMRYCGVEASFFPTMEAVSKIQLNQYLLARWQVHSEITLSTEAVQLLYEAKVKCHVQTVLQQHQEPDSWQDYTEEALLEAHNAQIKHIQTLFRESYPLADFRREYEAQQRVAFLQKQKAHQDIPADVLVAVLDGKVHVPPGSELVSQYGWEESERHGSQERWGIWLKEDSTENDMENATRNYRFDGFEKNLKDDAQRDMLIQNPYYYVQKGNTLLQGGQYHLAAKSFDRAIDLDSLYSVNARFNKARALLSPKENKNDHSEAKYELQEAYRLIGDQKSTLLSFDTLVGRTGKKPCTSEHVQHHIDILSQQENYIQAVIDVIESAQKEDWHVEITEIKSINEVFDKAEGKRTQALEEAAVNGFTHVFIIKEKEPKKWWSILTIALIGLAQITAGVFIAACTLGTGLTFAKGLISEGISDLITAVKAGIQGGFSWAEWCLQKAISLAVSLISAGWDVMKKGFASIKETVQNMGRTATVIGKQGMKVAMQSVGIELGKSVAKECVNALVNYGVDQLILKNIEEEIANKVMSKISIFLKQSKLVQAAIALDVKNKNNYWQNLLLQDGLALLAVKKDSKVLHAFKQIAKGVASNKIKGANAVLQSAAMHKALKEVMALTDDFLTSFSKKVEKDYEKKINAEQESEQKADEKRLQQEKEEEKQQQQVNQQICVPPPVEEEDIHVPLVAFQEDYKSDIRGYYFEAPSSASDLCSSFSGTITSHITNKVQGSMVRPVTGALVNISIDKMLEKVAKTVEANEEKFRAEGAQYYHANLMGNESWKKHKGFKEKDNDEAHFQEDIMNKGKVSTGNNEQSHLSGEANCATQPTSAANETMAQQVRAGAEAGIAELGAAAAELKQPIAIYDEKGRLLEILGRDHKGPLLKVQHFPSSDGSGHWEPYDSRSTSNASGATNCAYDALACQTEKVSSGASLREKETNRIATSVHTMELFHATKHLAIYNPPATRRGGNMYMYYYAGQRCDPHSTYNKNCLKTRDEQYAALQEELKLAVSSGTQTEVEVLTTKCRNMEIVALKTQNKKDFEIVKTIARTGVIIAAGATVTFTTSGTGLWPYLAGVGAMTGASMALDSELRQSVAVGDWSGTITLSSYHLPFVGSGRRSWDSWHAANYGSAALQAGMFGAEVLGMRWAGRVRGSAIQRSINTYENAKAGGKHAGMYVNYLARSPKELQRTIRSYQLGKRGINIHHDKIANPIKYDSMWDTYTRNHQKALLAKWQREIDDFTEQIQVLQGILKEKHS